LSSTEEEEGNHAITDTTACARTRWFGRTLRTFGSMRRAGNACSGTIAVADSAGCSATDPNGCRGHESSRRSDTDRRDEQAGEDTADRICSLQERPLRCWRRSYKVPQLHFVD